jgi:hypothetical protein
MATISRFRALAVVGRVQGAGFGAWLLWLVVHVVGLTGFKNRVSALFNWTVAFLGRGRPQRVITAQQVFARRALEQQPTVMPTVYAAGAGPRALEPCDRMMSRSLGWPSGIRIGLVSAAAGVLVLLLAGLLCVQEVSLITARVLSSAVFPSAVDFGAPNPLNSNKAPVGIEPTNGSSYSSLIALQAVASCWTASAGGHFPGFSVSVTTVIRST